MRRTGPDVVAQGHSTARRHGALFVLGAVLSSLVTIGPGHFGTTKVSASSAYQSAVVADSPSAYYRLGESSGTSAADQTSNSNTATTHGTTTWGAAGAIASDSSDNAITLDGSNGYLDAPDLSSLDAPSSAITLEAWVNPTSGDFGAQKPIIVKGYTSQSNPYYQYALTMADTGGSPKNVDLYLSIGGTVQAIGVNNTGWTYGSWSHIVATYDGSNMKLYVNGQLVGSQAQTGTIDNYATSMDIGAYANLPKNSSYLFGGDIDEAAVYSTALSAARVQAHYSAAQDISASAPGSYGGVVNSNSPASYWRVDETSGGHAADQSANQNTLAGHGGVTWNSTPGALVGDSDPSVALDGTSGYLDTPDAPSLDPTSAVTVEAWVNPTSGGAGHQEPIICKTTANSSYDYQYCLVIYDGAGHPHNVGWYVHVGGSMVNVQADNSGWVYGQWNHIVATYNGAHLYIYVNGKLAASATQTGSIDTYRSFATLGAYDFFAKNSTYLYKGGIDEAAVYPSALSAGDINRHFMASHRTVPVASNVASSEHYGNGGNAAGACSNSGQQQGKKGEPVDTESGNFTEAYTDIAIEGRSCPLEIARTYNSLAASTDGPFGYGWTYNYGMSLACSGTTATITQETGATVQFTTSGSCSSGTWTPAAPRFMATLSYSGGTWTFTRQNRDTYTFNSSGQFTSITDLNGYTTSLTYTSGNLTTITDPAGEDAHAGLDGKRHYVRYRQQRLRQHSHRRLLVHQRQPVRRYRRQRW